jgi:uncharacterized protein
MEEALMRYQQFGERYIIRLETGESVMESLKRFLASEHVGFASLSAVGAVEWVQLAFWNPDTQQYEIQDMDEPLEVVSFEGNASRKDGQPHLHLHGVFSKRDFSVLGGQIQDARVHPNLEVWVRAEEAEVRRVKDEATGLDLLDLPVQSARRKAA